MAQAWRIVGGACALRSLELRALRGSGPPSLAITRLSILPGAAGRD